MSEKAAIINPQDVRNNPINNSTSKMLFSFPKDKRFHDQDRMDPPFYNLPDIKDKRSTSLGFGLKIRFQDSRVIPSPNRYNINGDFDRTNSKMGFSFGVGRDQLKADSFTIFKTSTVPGPGSYDPKEMIKSRAALVRSRTKDHSLDQKIKVPGPGAYSIAMSDSLGKVFNSKFQNVKCPVIPRSFSTNLKGQAHGKSPTPWSYDPIILTRKGQKPICQGKAAKFSVSRRQGFIQYNKNPGPGQYNSFSQFTK